MNGRSDPRTGLKWASQTMEHLQLLFDRLDTPIGDMLLVVDDEGNLRATFWTDHDGDVREFFARHSRGALVDLQPASNPYGLTGAVAAYFAGDLQAIDTVPVKTGGTEFQREVWWALRRIPCGTSISYGELARRIGRPEAVRAVGMANGANPIGVVVPCHRVIGANGSLTGYGGGLERKRWLLDHERQMRL